MTHLRRAYDEASTPSEMTSDCEAAGRALRLPEQGTDATDSQPERQASVASEPISQAAADFAGSFVD
jgi:hypothetical protein